MKKLTALLLCLSMLFGFAACSAAGEASGTATLDIDYVTPKGYVEESQAEDDGSWFTWLRNKLTSDKEQQTAAARDAAAANPEEDTVAGMYGQNSPTGSGVSEDESSTSGASSKPSSSSSSSSADEQSSQSEQSSKPNDQSSKPEEQEDTKKNTVTMHIRCDTAVASGMHKEAKWAGIVPASGVILSTTTFEVKDGDTVFDLLCQVRDKYKIHMQYTGIANSSSTYIQGINNLYEFDGGRWSGWMYSVNGWYPNYGCGVYFVKAGDKIEWNYTCDLGRDLEGGGWMADEEWMKANE